MAGVATTMIIDENELPRRFQVTKLRPGSNQKILTVSVLKIQTAYVNVLKLYENAFG